MKLKMVDFWGGAIYIYTHISCTSSYSAVNMQSKFAKNRLLKCLKPLVLGRNTGCLSLFLHEAPCHLSSSRKVARSFTKVWRTWNRETLSMSFKFRRPVDFSKPEGKGDLFESDDSCREIRRTNIVKKNDFVGFNILECLPFDVSCPLFALQTRQNLQYQLPEGSCLQTCIPLHRQ